MDQNLFHSKENITRISLFIVILLFFFLIPILFGYASRSIRFSSHFRFFFSSRTFHFVVFSLLLACSYTLTDYYVYVLNEKTGDDSFLFQVERRFDLQTDLSVVGRIYSFSSIRTKYRNTRWSIIGARWTLVFLGFERGDPTKAKVMRMTIDSADWCSSPSSARSEYIQKNPWIHLMISKRIDSAIDQVRSTNCPSLFGSILFRNSSAAFAFEILFIRGFRKSDVASIFVRSSDELLPVERSPMKKVSSTKQNMSFVTSWQRSFVVFRTWVHSSFLSACPQPLTQRLEEDLSTTPIVNYLGYSRLLASFSSICARLGIENSDSLHERWWFACVIIWGTDFSFVSSIHVQQKPFVSI